MSVELVTCDETQAPVCVRDECQTPRDDDDDDDPYLKRRKKRRIVRSCIGV